jgi:SAM-dependent methyltransferase
LKQVLGVLERSEDPVAVELALLAVRADQLTECLLVASTGARYQLLGQHDHSARPAHLTVITALDEYRRASYEISQAIAPGWEWWRSRLEEAIAPVRDLMVRELAAPPASTVLELAAGAGDTGFQAASALSDHGQLICTDLSPAIVDVARRRAAELGLTTVDFRVMDAEHLDLDTDSVGGVLCRFGYMLVADPAAAFAETRRVMRSGGRLTLAVWGAAERNPFFTLAASTLTQHGHLPAPAQGTPGPFSMSNPGDLQAALETAGFSTSKLDEVPVCFSFTDLDEYVTFMTDTAGAVAIALQSMSERERHRVAAALEETLAPFATVDGYELPGAALVGVAS